jgi:acyl-CoA synthetase (AMP-forming)/AMP-acid ligase II
VDRLVVVGWRHDDVDGVSDNRPELPRTTSGKVRRAECAERLRDGRLEVLGRWPRG